MSNKNYIEPEVFVKKMKEHWTEILGNHSNRGLRLTWKQLAQAFKQNIITHGEELGTQWIVCQPPTGSGKTRGTILYSALLSNEVEEHPGVLVVTRLKEEADNFADMVNELSGHNVAIAHHSDSETSFEELSSWPVLIITHRAYELALDYVGRDGTIRDTFSFFHNFKSFEGKRKLIVIDECLDIIEEHQVQKSDINKLLQAIEELNQEFPFETEVLKKMKAQCQEQEFKRADNHDKIEKLDFSRLRLAISEANIQWDLIDRGRKNKEDRKKGQRRVDETLKSMEHLVKEFMYCANYNGKLTWNTARLLVPEDVKGAVVLDGTASTNTIYQLFDYAAPWSKPEGVRNYQNVTLHVSVGHKVGKQSMVENGQEVCEQLLNDLNGRLNSDSKVLIVTHKDVEPILKTFKPDFQMETGHWGAIQGRNLWNDCDTVVIFGIPYKPEICSTNAYQALKGPIAPEEIDPDTLEQMKQAKRNLKMGWIISDIIQAFNRIRCRKTIDAEGNCPLAEGYIAFKSKDEAEEILNAIRKEMPGIKIDWTWELATGEKRPKKSNFEEALRKYIETMSRGQYSKTDVAEYLGASPRTMDKLIDKAQNHESAINKAMTDNEVTLVTGKGRGNPTYFIK